MNSIKDRAAQINEAAKKMGKEVYKDGMTTKIVTPRSEYQKESSKVVTLEEAIRKMTSQPAARMKLAGKGILREGMDADVLVFDPENFRDHATFTEPAKLSTGLDYSIIGGQIVVDHGRIVTRNAGKSIRV